MEPKTLLLSHAEIAQLTPPQACLRVVHSAFARLAEGRLTTPAVGHIVTAYGGFHIKTAAMSSSPERVAIKVNGNFPLNRERGSLPTIQGILLLLDGESGAVLAIMDSAEITARRTAACSALAAQLLARPESSTLALIGCGTQARYHLEALAEIFPLAAVVLHDQRLEQARTLQRQAEQRRLAGHIASSAAEAAASADIIVTCTSSRAVLLSASDVRDGTFIAAVGADSVGKQELSTGLMKSCKVVPDILAQATQMGDLQHALAAGIMTSADVHGELADVVCGRVAARRSPAERFVFDSTGTAIADLAVAELVYEASGIGNPRTWIGLGAAA